MDSNSPRYVCVLSQPGSITTVTVSQTVCVCLRPSLTSIELVGNLLFCGGVDVTQSQCTMKYHLRGRIVYAGHSHHTWSWSGVCRQFRLRIHVFCFIDNADRIFQTDVVIKADGGRSAVSCLIRQLLAYATHFNGSS